MADAKEVAAGLTKAQREEITKNRAALNSWLEDFDRVRDNWMRPRGIEVEVNDLFGLTIRLLASYQHLLVVLTAEETPND